MTAALAIFGAIVGAAFLVRLAFTLRAIISDNAKGGDGSVSGWGTPQD